MNQSNHLRLACCCYCEKCSLVSYNLQLLYFCTIPMRGDHSLTGIITVLAGYSDLQNGKVNMNICGLSAECFGWSQVYISQYNFFPRDDDIDQELPWFAPLVPKISVTMSNQANLRTCLSLHSLF